MPPNYGGDMNRLLAVMALSILMYAGAAEACPQLEGTYTCPNGDGTNSLTTFRQEMRSGVMVYHLDVDGEVQQEIITDGNSHSVSEHMELRNGMYVASCSVGILNVNTTGEIVMEELDMILFLDATTVVTPNANGFMMETSGTVSGDFGVEPIEQEINNCTRM